MIITYLNTLSNNGNKYMLVKLSKFTLTLTQDIT